MSKIVQLYSDENKTIKAYPKTLADSVYLEDGVTSVGGIVNNKIPQLQGQLDNITSGVVYLSEFLKYGDNEAFKKAIAKAKEEKKSCIFISERSKPYVINETLDLDEVSLIGQGNGRNILIQITQPIPIITFRRGNLENFTLINSDNSNINSKGIVIGNSNANNCKVEIKNITFGSGFYDCIYSNVELDNTVIEGIVSFSPVGRGVIYIDTQSIYPASAGLTIKRCHIASNVSKYGIYVNRGDNNNIIDNISNGFEYCIYLREHWALNCSNNHTESRYAKTHKQFDGVSLSVITGDYVIQQDKNTNGCIYEVLSNGTLTSDTGWKNTGEVFVSSGVSLKKVRKSVGLHLSLVKQGRINGGTLDNFITGIEVADSRIVIDGLGALGNCCVSVDNVSNGGSNKIQILNSTIRGCLRLKKASSHGYIVKNSSVTNNTANTIGELENYTYSSNLDSSMSFKKTITETYDIDIDKDLYIFCDTSQKPISVVFPIKNTADANRKFVIINTGDNAVNISTRSYTPSVTLEKKGESATFRFLGHPNYYFIESVVRL